MLVCTSCGEENPDRARFCLACAAPLTAPAPERRKLATLLFCDLSGSTAMGERVDAESVRDLMFRYFHEMRSAIERHGGTVEKFVGDAVMAVFGVPTAHEDDALRAVRAAAEMRERLERLNEDLDRGFGVRLAVRIGVNTGEVVAGVVSTRETLVTGDAVNVAARLEQAAGTNEILLGDLTRRLCRTAVTVEAVEPLALNGKAEPVPAYRLLAVAPAVAFDMRRQNPLIARRSELAALEAALAEAVSEARCVLATVVGEPGIGKSRLVADFTDRLAGTARIVQGRCLSYGEGITFFPLAQIVRDAAGVHDEQAPNEAVARIAELLAGARDRRVVTGHLAAAIGLTDAATTAPEVTWAVRRLFEALAVERPVVAVIEDVHWGEPALLDLLQEVVARATAPILLLCTARPELRETRSEWPVSLSLEPLTDDDVSRLVMEALDRVTVPPLVTRRIVNAAGGNPLFVEELLAMLLEDGLLRRTNASWLATTDLSELAIPPTVNALLADRLDRLPEMERAAAERASIEGEVFHRGAVHELSPPRERDAVVATLQALVDRDLVRPAAATFADEAAHRFKHVLVRDAAYAGIPKKVRAELHELFAAWLARMAGEREAEHAEFLGYHLEQAYRYRRQLGPLDENGIGLGRSAAEQLASAGRRALARGDAAAAGNLFGRAADLLLPDDPALLGFLSDFAAALTETGPLDLAHELVSRAVDLARATRDVRAEAHASLRRAEIGTLLSPDEAASMLRDEAGRALRIFEGAGDEVGLGRAWYCLGQAAWLECRFGEARELLARSAAHSARGNDRHTESVALMQLVACEYFGPTPVSAGLIRIDEALADAGPAASHPSVQQGALVTRGNFLAMQGRFDEARRLCDRAAEIVRDMGNDFLTGAVAGMRGHVELLAADLPAAEAFLRRSWDILVAMGDRAYASTTVAEVAETVLALGREHEALELTREAEELAGTDDAVTRVKVHALLGRLHARAGDVQEAERHVRQAVALVERTDMVDITAETYLALAEVLVAADRRDDARIAAQNAVRLFEMKENVVSAERAAAVVVELAAAATA